MFKVIKKFTDLQDDRYLYNEGDTYPRKGFKVSSQRLEELSTSSNRRGEPLIKEVKRATKKTTDKTTEKKPSKKK